MSYDCDNATRLNFQEYGQYTYPHNWIYEQNFPYSLPSLFLIAAKVQMFSLDCIYSRWFKSQVYQGLDVGSAKPSPDDRKVHNLDIEQSFTFAPIRNTCVLFLEVAIQSTYHKISVFLCHLINHIAWCSLLCD